MDILLSHDWIRRCAQRIGQLDQQIADEEARALAQDLRGFERTAAMAPEDAADFVASELARAAPRFERRTVPRA